MIIAAVTNSNSGVTNKTHAAIAGEKIIQSGSSTWIEQFREFRDAVYKHDKGKVRTFVDFPIMNDNNEIWYLVYGGDEKAINMLSKKIKPFTEKDFDLYFDKLFSNDFINAILKIKTAELYTNGETETIKFHKGKATTYQIDATFDKPDNTLSLNLSSKTIIKDKDGETEDGGESSTIYMFKISPQGKLKFIQVRLAG